MTLLALDDLLRARRRHAVGGERVPWGELSAILAGGGLLYGGVMGSFGESFLQAVYSGLKVPLLLAVASLLCLPSFFVVNTLLGLREDFAAACRGLLAAQATLSVALAALAPWTGLAYLSSADYRFAVLFNGAVFALATLGGQVTLARHYRPLIAANPRHRVGRAAWLVLYVFVSIQMAWVLRPFVGAPGLPTRFFREHAWSNAYVVVTGALRDFIAGK
jgi:hypothetical protein